MKLAIVVVTYRCCEDAVRCLQSIRANPPSCDYKIVVVDNDSRDGTVEAVRPLVDVMIVNARNEGFARAVNRGVEAVPSEFVLVVNPDTIVHPCALDVMLEFMHLNPKTAVVGPLILNRCGRPNRSDLHFPSFLECLRPIQYALPFTKPAKFHAVRKSPSSIVDYVQGSCLLVRMSSLSNGEPVFDEDFFLYSEEVDLCKRLSDRGWEIHFVLDATVTHIGEQSSRSDPVLTYIEIQKSQVIYIRKHLKGIKRYLVLASYTSAMVCLYCMSSFTYNIARNSERSRNRNVLMRNAMFWYLTRSLPYLHDGPITFAAPWETAKRDTETEG